MNNDILDQEPVVKEKKLRNFFERHKITPILVVSPIVVIYLFYLLITGEFKGFAAIIIPFFIIVIIAFLFLLAIDRFILWAFQSNFKNIVLVELGILFLTFILFYYLLF